jgi:hypothetical protein
MQTENIKKTFLKKKKSQNQGYNLWLSKREQTQCHQNKKETNKKRF